MTTDNQVDFVDEINLKFFFAGFNLISIFTMTNIVYLVIDCKKYGTSI